MTLEERQKAEAWCEDPMNTNLPGFNVWSHMETCGGATECKLVSNLFFFQKKKNKRRYYENKSK